MKLCVSWDESVCITGFVCTHTLQARCGTFLTNETGLTKVVELERRILETVKEICLMTYVLGVQALADANQHVWPSSRVWS